MPASHPSHSLRLYRFALSGHAHRVELFLSILGLPVELIDVDLPKGEHKQPAFLALNPLGQVPVLVDFFMAIGESAVQSLLSGKGQWTPDELGTLVAHFIQGGITSALTPSDKAGSPSNKKASSS